MMEYGIHAKIKNQVCRLNSHGFVQAPVHGVLFQKSQDNGIHPHPLYGFQLRFSRRLLKSFRISHAEIMVGVHPCLVNCPADNYMAYPIIFHSRIIFVPVLYKYTLILFLDIAFRWNVNNNIPVNWHTLIPLLPPHIPLVGILLKLYVNFRG